MNELVNAILIVGFLFLGSLAIAWAFYMLMQLIKKTKEEKKESERFWKKYNERKAQNETTQNIL